jgi:hypothetical protein
MRIGTERKVTITSIYNNVSRSKQPNYSLSGKKNNYFFFMKRLITYINCLTL